MGVLETNTQGRSGIIYALNMMLLTGEPPKIGISFNPLLSLQPNRLPKFGKEKEPGILRMQADTVMLNPGSTSENKVALIYSRVGRALPLHWPLPQFIGLTINRLYESSWCWLGPSPTKRVTGGALQQLIGTSGDKYNFNFDVGRPYFWIFEFGSFLNFGPFLIWVIFEFGSVLDLGHFWTWVIF